MSGAIAIVVTLIYLAMQVKQSDRLARAEMKQRHAETVIGLEKETFTNRTFSELRLRVRNVGCLNDLSEVERVEIGSWFSCEVERRRQAFFLNREGILDDETLMRATTSFRWLISAPALNELWQSRKHFHDSAFLEHIERESDP